MTREPPADGRIVVLHFPSACCRDQFGQRCSPDAGKRKVNNVGIAEEVVKEWFDGFQRVGSTQLKENYPYTPCCARHSPDSPEPRNVLRSAHASQWRIRKSSVRKATLAVV